MNKKNELVKIINEVLNLKEKREDLKKYLYNIDENLVYELYAVYYTGRDGKIELGINEDFQYHLNHLKHSNLEDLINKITTNPLLNRFLPIGMKLLQFQD